MKKLLASFCILVIFIFGLYFCHQESEDTSGKQLGEPSKDLSNYPDLKYSSIFNSTTSDVEATVSHVDISSSNSIISSHTSDANADNGSPYLLSTDSQGRQDSSGYFLPTIVRILNTSVN